MEHQKCGDAWIHPNLVNSTICFAEANKTKNCGGLDAIVAQALQSNKHMCCLLVLRSMHVLHVSVGPITEIGTAFEWNAAFSPHKMLACILSILQLKGG